MSPLRTSRALVLVTFLTFVTTGRGASGVQLGLNGWVGFGTRFAATPIHRDSVFVL